MGNFEETRKAKDIEEKEEKAKLKEENKEEVRKKNDVRKEKIAGYFFDLSKLSFAGMVIGGFTPLLSNLNNEANWLSAICGIITTYTFAFFANRILK